MNAEKMPEIVGIGHAMCDINAVLDYEAWNTLEKNFHQGHSNMPLHVDNKEASEIVDFILKNIKDNNLISYNAGGSALNTMRVASFLGRATAFYGYVGADVYGNVVREGLRASNVRDMLIQDREKNAATGIFCTVRRADSGDIFENSHKLVIASPSLARKIREIDVGLFDLNEARFLHVEGLLADTPLFLDGLIQRCIDAGVSISIDFVSVEFVRRHRVALIEAIKRGINIVFCTKREFEALDCDPRALSEKIMWIIKADRNGVDCYSGGQQYHIEAPRCRVIDEIGAGDAFAGAFLSARIAGKNIPKCLELASASAACALSAMGPSPERTCIEALRREFLAN